MILETGKYYRVTEKPDGYGMGTRTIVGKYIYEVSIDNQVYYVFDRGLQNARALCKIDLWSFQPLSSLEAELY
jgi:hypothetical protein